jgi:hypothetical protein
MYEDETTTLPRDGRPAVAAETPPAVRVPPEAAFPRRRRSVVVEIWVREPHDALGTWHALEVRARIQGLTRCGRSARLAVATMWPIRRGEPGPAPADLCPECHDQIIREEGRLPLA